MLKQAPEHHHHHCHLNIDKEIGSHCKVKLNVKISKEDAGNAYNQAVKEISKSVNVPGFRRGKAPKKIIEDQYGDHVKKEWKRQLVNNTLEHAISHVDEKPLGGRIQKADLEDFSQEGATLHVEYESEPKSPVVDISGFDLKEEPQEQITDEDVNKTIDRLRQYHATWNDVTDRPIQEGDWVSLKIECLDEPKMIICSDTQFHIKKGEVANWILQLVMGKKKGDMAEGQSVQDQSDEEVDEKIDFKPALYQITVQEVKEPTLPDLNDELAKKLGAATPEDLIKKVRENLENEKKLYLTLKNREQLADFLCDKYPIDLPASLYEYEKRVLLQNRIEGFLARGITQEWIKENIKTITEQTEKLAATRLRLIYILREEAQKLGIKVLVSDLQKEMMYERYIRPADERIIHPEMKEEEKEGRLYFTLLTEKTLDRILETRQIA